jgi:hypothetical protein
MKISCNLCHGILLRGNDFCILYAAVTHMSDQTSACILEHGSHLYRVKKFRIIAANKKERKNDTCTPNQCSISDAIGTIFTTLIATIVHHNNTHKKFINHDRTTAILGFIERVYTTVATAFAVSWNPFINSKTSTNIHNITIRR